MMMFSRAICPRTRYFKIFVTTPAPTVRPPSRIANRSCSSIAIGVISSIVIFVLSPGITISTPAQLHRPRHVRRPQIKLRPIPLEERRMPPAFFLRQDVHLTLKLRVRRDALRLRQHHPPLHLVLLHTTQHQPPLSPPLPLVTPLVP